MSNQKEFFKSSELAHAWAHRGAPKGRCPSSMTFEGDTYYSYSTPIAHLVTGKGGRQGVIINQTSYSVTTSGHQANVRCAIPDDWTRFYVSGIGSGYSACLPKTATQLRDFYVEEFKAPLPEKYNPKTDQIERKPSRLARIRAREFLSKIDSLVKAIEACKFFGLSSASLEAQLDRLQPKIAEQTAIANAHQDKLDAARVKRGEAATERRKIRERFDRDQAKIRAEKFIAGESDPAIGGNADFFGGFGSDWQLNEWPDLQVQVAAKRTEIAAGAVEAWWAGDSSHLVTRAVSGLTLLRREGEEVVTSRGARIPADHARKAFFFVKHIKDHGEAWKSNGKTFSVGVYGLDSVETDGTVRAGCHVIPYSEIESLATREGWLSPKPELQPA